MTETIADRIQDIAREIRGPDDEGRLMFNTLYDIGEQVAALTAERTQLRAESDSLRVEVARLQNSVDTLLAFVNGKITRAELDNEINSTATGEQK